MPKIVTSSYLYFFQVICIFIFQKPKLNSVHDVLSCQSLTELRDVIQCPMDLMVLGEYSDNPHVPKDIRAKVNIV